MEVIPVINCLDLDCVVDELHRFEKFSSWVHLDIADGRFTFHKTWNDPVTWAKLAPKPNTEVHLMVEEPETAVEAWCGAGAKRVIVHLETVSEAVFDYILDRVTRQGAEVMLAINPETPVERLAPYFGKVKSFQILAVHPGLAGQQFLTPVLEKIKSLRSAVPDATIEVDGGVNQEIAKLAKDAGASIVTSSKYILESKDMKHACEELQNV